MDKATTSLHKSSAVSLVASDPASARPPRSILRCFHLLTSGFRFFLLRSDQCIGHSLPSHLQHLSGRVSHLMHVACFLRSLAVSPGETRVGNLASCSHCSYWSNRGRLVACAAVSSCLDPCVTSAWVQNSEATVGGDGVLTGSSVVGIDRFAIHSHW